MSRSRNRDLLVMLAQAVEAPATTTEEWDAEELARVRYSLLMAVAAESIPRRLGAAATGAQLALDKRLARKVANLYRSMWAAYAVHTMWDEAPDWTTRAERLALVQLAEPAMRSAGATVQWPAWLKQRKADVKDRRAQVAALSMAHGLVRWGTRRVGLLTIEIDNIERIAADAVERVRRAA